MSFPTCVFMSVNRHHTFRVFVCIQLFAQMKHVLCGERNIEARCDVVAAADARLHSRAKARSLCAILAVYLHNGLIKAMPGNNKGCKFPCKLFWIQHIEHHTPPDMNIRAMCLAMNIVRNKIGIPFGVQPVQQLQPHVPSHAYTNAFWIAMRKTADGVAQAQRKISALLAQCFFF